MQLFQLQEYLEQNQQTFFLCDCLKHGGQYSYIASEFEKKMIVSNQQIAVHINTLRNLTSFNSGRYALRLSLAEAAPHQSKATPVSIIQKEQSASDNHSDFDEEHFMTKSFTLKAAVNVDISEIYIFKFDSVMSDGKEEDVMLELIIEFIHFDSIRQKVVSQYRSLIDPQAQHQYFEADFYEVAPSQVTGTIHRCPYKFQFRDGDIGIDLKTFSQKFCINGVEQVYQYLQNEGFKNYQSLAQNSSRILKQEIEIDCVELEQSILSKVIESQIDLWDGETQIGSAEDQMSFDSKIGAKRRRQRIFSITKDTRGQKYQIGQKKLHENAQKIYSLWRDLLPKLLKADASAYLKERTQHYRNQLILKSKESVSSFKGSWDSDMYGEETVLRDKLASQLRNQNHQIYKELSPCIHNEFPIYNPNLFTNKRPIFFEEKACKSGIVEEPLQNEIIVILVHGLGACRMDMERLKIELRRYYDKKVKIFSSSTNEGRTDGQIQLMGMRLASEVDYELSRYSTVPKICMVGHSMGGLIIRAALPRLQKYKKYFHSFVTLSSPHLGYAYSASRLIDAGLWFMNTVKKCSSLLQMTMNDHEKPQQTFLYKLSLKPGLQWFKKVVFLGSHQDHYVPYYSARVQKHQESLDHERDNVKRGKLHCEMVNNILSKCKGTIYRLDINFCPSEQNFDNLIGRAAHINFITNTEMLRTLALAGKHYFF